MNILYINKNSSRCGNCNKGCNPYEAYHDIVFGWQSVGCHCKYTHVSSDYAGMDDTVKDMRPDLIWLDPISLL